MPSYYEENLRRFQEALKKGTLTTPTPLPEEEPLWLRGWKGFLRQLGGANAATTGVITGITGGLGNLLSGDVQGALETFKERYRRQMAILDTVESVHDVGSALKATGAVLLDAVVMNPLETIGDAWVDIGRLIAGVGVGVAKGVAFATGDTAGLERGRIYGEQYLKWLDWKRIGALSMLVDMSANALGLAPTRTVYVRDRTTGDAFVYNIRASLLPAFRKEMEMSNKEVLSVSGATSAEEFYSGMLYGLDIVTPIPNAVLGVAGRVGWMLPKAEGRLASMGLHKLNAVLSHTPMGSMIEKTIRGFEKNIGIPLTEKSIQFMRVLSPLQRIRNAQVEQAKQHISDIEEYLLTGGGRFGRMLENEPDVLRSRYGTAIDGLEKTRAEIEKRIENYLKTGLNKEEAIDIVRKELRKAEAMSLFALTGLPFHDEVIEMLQRADADPDEAYRLIRQWAQERGYTPNMKAIQTIINGDYHLLLGDKTIDVNLVKSFEGIIENPHLFMQAFVSPSEKIDKLQKIWNGSADYSKVNWKAEMTDLTPEEERLLIDITRPYKKDFANRLRMSLYLLMRTADPDERRIMAQMIAIYAGSRGRNIHALAKRLGMAEDDDAIGVMVNTLERLKNPKTAQQVLDNLNAMQGQKLDNIAEEMRLLKEMLERNGLGDLDILISNCADAVATQTAKLSGLLALPPIQFAYSLMTDVGGSAVHIEDVLRSKVIQALEAKGRSLTDLSDEAQRWLGGDINFLRPVVLQSEHEAVRFLRDVAFASGLDENLLFTILDANKHVQQIIAKTLGIETDQFGRELEATIFNWGTWKQALSEYASRLEKIGRIKEASELHYALEQTDNIADMIDFFRSFEERNDMYTRLRNDIFSYFGALMWKKEDILHTANRILDDLADLSVTKNFGFFSTAPTPVLYKQIEGTGTKLDGMYTTEYIENVIKRMTGGDDRLWKGWLDGLNNYLKKALVVWSPLAIFRDFVSNAGSIMFGLDLAPYQYPLVLKWYLNAWRSIRRGDMVFQEYAKYSPSAYTIADTIGSLEHEVVWGLAEASATKRGLYKLGQLPILKHMQKLRSFSEAMGKLAFVHAIDDMFKDVPAEELLKHFNMKERYFVGRATESMALKVAMAEKYLIDYNDVPPAIHFLRRYTGLFPFITWESKIINVMLSDWSSRSVFLQRLFHAITTGEKIANADDPDTATNSNILRGYLRDNPLAISYLDERGKIRIIDFSYFLPLGALLPLERIANNMLDVDGYLREIRQRMGSIVPTLFEVLLNRELYSGREIYSPNDPSVVKMKKIANHLSESIPTPILPRRLLMNYVQDIENEGVFQKMLSDYNETKWWETLLSMYTIDPDKIMITKAEQHRRIASRLVGQAKKVFNETLQKTNNLKEAEEAMGVYLREAENHRYKAHELYEAGFKLRHLDAENSRLLLNSAVGYNPLMNRNYIKAQTEVMTMLYDSLRERGVFAQKTDKWDIIEILVNSAERLYRGIDALDDINYVYSTLLDAVNEGNRENLRNWLRTNIETLQRGDVEGMPLEPPLLVKPEGIDPEAIASWFITRLMRNPQYTVDGKPIGIEPSLVLQQFQQLMTETMKGGRPNRLMLETFTRWANTMRKQFVPSQGNVPVAQRGLRGENR